MRDEADLAGLALGCKRLDVVRDVLGGSLSVSEAGVRQCDPAYVEARSRVGQQLDVRSVGPSTLGCRGGASVQSIRQQNADTPSAGLTTSGSSVHEEDNPAGLALDAERARNGVRVRRARLTEGTGVASIVRTETLPCDEVRPGNSLVKDRQGQVRNQQSRASLGEGKEGNRPLREKWSPDRPS